jgi:ketosteroid isomerase-like protein
MSHRTVIDAAAGAHLVAAADDPEMARARIDTGLASNKEKIIREYYAAWEEKNWLPFEVLLADNFAFTSAAGDDHIGKGAFKVKCWESQIDFIDRFDLLHIFGSGDEAVVMYVCRTKNGKTFRNVEYFRLRDYKVEAIECYFGAQSSFPAAVSSGPG